MTIRTFADFRKSTRTLEEQATIFITSTLNILMIVFHTMFLTWDIFLLNSFIIMAILLVSSIDNRMGGRRYMFFRDWYIPVFLLFIYLENRRLIPLVNPHDLDDYFIRIDRFLLLGHDPTVLLEKFSFPLLSEVLQLSYASFYFIPFTLTLLVYLYKPRIDFHIVMSTLLIGFYLSFLGYYITPVIGPRFTLDQVQGSPLTGVYLFSFIRNLLAGIEGVMRDCCPSGHALISLISVLLARKYFRPFFLSAAVWSSLVIFSTVYLRYHYMADIIAGLALGCAVYLIVPDLLRYILRYRMNSPESIESAAHKSGKSCMDET